MQSNFNAALRTVLEQPGNSAASFNLVQAAVAAGDLRIAISALERILLLNPELDNIRFELGFLYIRAGLPEVGVPMVEKALASGDVPEEVRARGETLVRATNDAQKRFRITGRAFGGIAYDSNANAAAESALVEILGPNNTPVLATLIDPNSIAEDDFSAVTTANLRVEYDLGFQSGHTIFADAGYYGKHFFERGDINLDVISLGLGTNIFFGKGGGLPVTVSPSLTYDHVIEGSDNYLNSYKARLAVTTQFNRRLAGGLNLFAGYDDFLESAENPILDSRDAGVYGGGAYVTYLFTPTLRGFISADAERFDANVGYEAYSQAGARVGLAKLFKNIVFPEAPVIRLSGYVGFRHRFYDTPDPVISLEDREDNRTDLGLSVELPIHTNVALQFDVYGTRNQSNYDINEFENLGSSGGLVIKF
ncbi:hypothetical protein [Roseibium album]|uniref:hypothetical protein n=1 Tax=Roseibium album TaxID=311410 RepID=UPI003BB0E1C7